MNIGIKEAFAFGVPYLIAVGACYQFGYWGAFNINALEFITFADIAKLTVYPLTASLVFFLAGILMYGILMAQVGFPRFTPEGGSPVGVKVTSWVRKYWRMLYVLLIFAIIQVVINVPEPKKWMIVAILFSLLCPPGIYYHEKLIKLIPNPRIRSTTLMLLLFLPIFSFAHGRQQAFLVKTGASEQFVDVARSKLPLVSDEKNPVAYLGFLGSVYILREAKTGQIVFVKQSDDSLLFLAPKPQ